MVHTSVGNATVTFSRTTIRGNVAKFAISWAGVSSESAEKQTFWNEWFDCFGVPRRTVANYEYTANRYSRSHPGAIDLFWPKQLAVEHKSAGYDLDKAMAQLRDYEPINQPGLSPRFLIVCDFDRWVVVDADAGTERRFSTTDLVDNLDLFWWIAGYAPPAGAKDFSEIEANLHATALLAQLHDRIRAAGYELSSLREWMTRILFCLFADDAGVWDRHAFHNYLLIHTAEDGHDLGQILAEIFRVLNTPIPDRPSTLHEELRDLTYINGDLFQTDLWAIPGDRAIRDALISACEFDWSIISPTIFGSLFQNVMDTAERRQLGAHYTTRTNILRTLRPLFLDDLEDELKKAGHSRAALLRFHEKISDLRMLDPACGCGNFLVVAYRELRRLETEVLTRLRSIAQQSGQLATSLTLLCKVQVDHFYGIEIEEFPALIARTALYLADHLENRAISREFGEHYVRFPIPATPHIRLGNALRLDWNDLLPAAEANYVFGNPPFAGHVTRSIDQADDLKAVWGASAYAKWLDYVTGWYRKSLDYGATRSIKFGFVSTNSISQGEQVARLWDPLYEAGFNIDWAHRTFAWTNEASGQAHVHVVIVGFSWHGGDDPRLYSYADPRGEPTREAVSNISPYLIEGPRMAVAGRASLPLSRQMPTVKYGSLPADGGHLIVHPDEYPSGDLVALKYLRRYVGSNELVKNLDRWVIWMPDGPEPGDLSRSAFLRDRLEAVREWRLTNGKGRTQMIAGQPYLFFHNGQPESDYLGIPAQVSESRRWYTVSALEKDVIASNTLYTAPDADGFLFGLLSSAMMRAWVGTIGGRLESRLRYSKSVVHNTFPLPDTITARKRSAVIEAGQGVLLVRGRFPDASLAGLYDPLGMPRALVAAHKDLDRAVDSLFSRRARLSEPERLSILLRSYARLRDTAALPGLTSTASGSSRRRRRR